MPGALSEPDILIPIVRNRTLGGMTGRRLIRVAIAVAAIWIGLFLVGYWLFSSEGDGPPVEVVTTP